MLFVLRCIPDLVGDVRERDHLEDQGINEIIILIWIFRKIDGAWTGLIWLRILTCRGNL